MCKNMPTKKAIYKKKLYIKLYIVYTPPSGHQQPQFLPRKVPTKNTFNGTLITGDVILINQLGRKGVILKNIM